VARKKYPTRPGPYLLHAELLRNVVPSFDEYPYRLPVVRNFERLAFHPKVTFFVGENGSGKSTVLEALAVAYGLNPEGGTRNFNFQTRGSHSSLADSLRLSKAAGVLGDAFFLRAESYFNVATEIERLDQEQSGGPPIISYYGGVSLHEQSHGESFFALFKNRFRHHGLYFLDEPEAALSPTRQLEFLALLHDFVLGGAQFVIATHSPIILAYSNATILLFDGSGIREVAYTDTDHYKVTRGFLSNHKAMLNELLKPKN
jgi:predicted ATPase